MPVPDSPGIHSVHLLSKGRKMTSARSGEVGACERTMNKIRNGIFGLCAIAAATCIAQADPVTYNFANNIGNNTATTGAEFSMTITNLGGNVAEFTLANAGPAGSAITGIWFYDGVILGGTALIDIDNSNVSGVFEENKGTPNNLPGGNAYGLTNTTREFYTASGAGGINNGIYTGQWLTITMEFEGTFQGLLDALESGFNVTKQNKFQTGDLVIGIQVQGLENGGSDQFLMTGDLNDPNSPGDPSIIPLPAPVWMGLAGLAGIMVIRRRRA